MTQTGDLTSPPGTGTTSLSGAEKISSPTGSGRLLAVDAFRGAVMLLMASSGFGFAQVSASLPGNRLWHWLGQQCEHALWRGLTLWDLIQPAFMFLVGVAVPLSMGNRRARQQPPSRLMIHACRRALLLVLLGIFLTSAWSSRTEWVFTNVLCQIGLGYPVVALLYWSSPRTQWVSTAGILALYWLLFAIHPIPGPETPWAAFGLGPEWKHLEGFAGHWEKNVNSAAAFDRWFLNLFPRETPYVFSSGGYQTLNFVPSIATMLFGMRAGVWLQSPQPAGAKVRRLIYFGLVVAAMGWSMDFLGICPVIKRIWTPSWTLASAGVTAWMLAAFVYLLKSPEPGRWSFPLVVAGTNPLALYCLWQLSAGFFRDTLRTHLGQGIFAIPSATFAPIWERLAVLTCFWLILFWMHRRRIFLKL